MSALLLVALLALVDPPPVPTATDGTPVPTPTPAAPATPPRLLAALDVSHGETGERIALFDDRTLVHAVRYKGRVTSNRKTLSVNETEVFVAVAEEALRVPEDDWSGTVLISEDRRTHRLEVADGRGVRTFTFDDLSRLPLAIGRVRGALDDLRSRFFVVLKPKDELWDPAVLKLGDLVRRRSDGRWFRIVGDDVFNPNLEILDTGPDSVRFFLPREEVPRTFEDPATQDPPKELRRR